MCLQTFLFIVTITVFKVETLPIKILQINEQQTKDYEVFKDILIQNLIVTTDNLKLILNLERENTHIRQRNNENINHKIINKIFKNPSPLQFGSTSKTDLLKDVHDKDQFTTQNIAKDEMSKNKGSIELFKYFTKRSSEDGDPKNTELLLINEITNEDDISDEVKATNNKREANDYSPIILSEENLLNYGNSDPIKIDNNNADDTSMNVKRQADSGGDSVLPKPVGDSETQMFMGTFQAVMRPMKLPGVPKMNYPVPTECIVTGTLAVALRMSQIVGVAPLAFKKTRDGWIIRVSLVWNCYGQILGSLLCILSVATIAVDITIEPEKSFRMHTNSTRIVWVADVATVVLVVIVTVITGRSRMRSLIGCLLELQKTNLRLNLYHDASSNERTRMIIVISSMALALFNIFTDYSLFIYRVFTENGKLVISTTYIFYNLNCVILQIMHVQFFAITASVLTSIRRVNSCLKTLLQEIVNDKLKPRLVFNKMQEHKLNMDDGIPYKSINSVIDTMTVYKGTIKTTPKLMAATIRSLILFYCSICDVLRQVNDSNGAVLVTLLLSLLLHLVITPYHIITNTFNVSRSDRSSPLLQYSWVVLHFVNLLLIIEPCHRTHEQMELTKHLISQMTRFTPPEHDALLSELEMFYRHLMLNDVSHAPMKMLSLNRTLIVSILGSITTYLVVMVQL